MSFWVKIVKIGLHNVDNKSTEFILNGRALEIPVGNVKPRQSKEVTFEVRVLDMATGTTVYNTVIANRPDGNPADPGVEILNPETPPELDVFGVVTGKRRWTKRSCPLVNP